MKEEETIKQIAGGGELSRLGAAKKAGKTLGIHYRTIESWSINGARSAPAKLLLAICAVLLSRYGQEGLRSIISEAREKTHSV